MSLWRIKKFWVSIFSGSEPVEPNKNVILRLIKALHPVTTNTNLIRMGGSGDGGYLLPDDLEGIKACFSPGVGPTSQFENECAEIGIKVYMADASVDSPVLANDNMQFIKKFIGKQVNENFISMQNWIDSAQLNSDSDLILQMDIEGAEYDVINTLPASTLKRFRIVIIECHSLELLWKKSYFHRANKAFRKLLRHYKCVHIHPNNCCGIREIEGIEFPSVAEFTFYRKDRIRSSKKANKFPHALDEDNMKNETIVLPKIWYT